MDNTEIDAFSARAGLVGGPDADDTRLEVAFAAAALGLTAGQRVLDLPCGNGRHAALLAGRGLRVTAVDVNPDTVALARRACADTDVQLAALDARAVGELGGGFDAVLSLFSWLGYLADEAEDAAAVAAMAGTLRPGGHILLSTANAAVIARAGATRVVFEAGALQIDRSDEWQAARRRLHRRFVVHDRSTGETTTIEQDRRLYSADEVVALLARCGVAARPYAADFTGAAFSAGHSPHAVYLGQREPG